MLLGRRQRALGLEWFSSQGLLEKQGKNGEASIMAHVLRTFIRHLGLWWSGQWECGGEGLWAHMHSDSSPDKDLPGALGHRAVSCCQV